uniref:PD-(D/E)XK nuclease domain-containing protein n=1 Tax=Succinivibrio sp. TaxID=2053619 RepID=UPI00402A8ED2
MDLTGIIGFTKDETYKFLEDYEMDDYATDVKNNYDGYKFCDKEMFCPWDVVNFIKENYKNNLNGHTELVKANNYWANSSSDSALGEYLGYLTDSDTRKMQDLVDGKSISFILNDSMNYDSLSEHDPNDFWSLLLHTGYLTLDWDKSNNKELRINTVSNNDVFVRIPNLEIKNCFKDSIQRRFNKEIAPNSVADEIATALLNGDNSFAQTKLRAILMRFISLRDNATKAPLENYYLGYLNGLFTNCSENFFSEYHSNNEAGNGYSDISFADTFSEKAVIIELKVGSLGSDLVSLSEKALSQIEEKNYAEPFLQNSMTQSIFAYGIAFSGKNCLLACKKLK